MYDAVTELKLMQSRLNSMGDEEDKERHEDDSKLRYADTSLTEAGMFCPTCEKRKFYHWLKPGVKCKFCSEREKRGR